MHVFHLSLQSVDLFLRPGLPSVTQTARVSVNQNLSSFLSVVALVTLLFVAHPGTNYSSQLQIEV